MKHLEEKYKKLLSFNVEQKKNDPTLFEISSFAHFENTITNWYSFFFDSKAEHRLGKLFLDSLLNTLNNESNLGDFFLDHCNVIREYYTGKGFIDLLLHDGENEKMDNVIILENKIHASVQNDLDDYFSSIACNNKIGVLLTLNKINTKNPNFINITHKKFLQNVENNLGKYWTNSRDKYLVYLKDFIKNIYSLSNDVEMNENIKFYLKYSSQIDQLLELQRESINFLADSIKQASIQDNNLEWERKNSGSVTLRVENESLRLYVFYNHVFSEKKVDIELWAKDQYIKEFTPKIRKAIENKVENIDIDWNEEGKIWLRVGTKNYNNLTSKDIENFGQFIFNIINKDWTEHIDNIRETINLNQ